MYFATIIPEHGYDAASMAMDVHIALRTFAFKPVDDNKRSGIAKPYIRKKGAHSIDYAIVENTVLHAFPIATFVPDANITDFGK
jgi:hypothetical protein